MGEVKQESASCGFTVEEQLADAKAVLAAIVVDIRTGVDAVAVMLDLSTNEDDGEASMAYLDAARELVTSLSSHFHNQPEHAVSEATRACMVSAGLVPA